MSLLLALLLGCEPSPTPPAGMLPDSAGEWRLRETATFDRTDLFDFIDGGAEVYLAYGFGRMWVGTYHAPEQPLIEVEVYDMGSSDDAYGVLSVDPTGEDVSIGLMARYGAGLLRFCKGRWFVRVLAEAETPATREAVLGLGRRVEGVITEKSSPPSLLTLLPTSGLVPDTTTFFHTQVTLNHLYYLSEGNLLRLGPDVCAAFATYRIGKAEGKLLLIQYPSDGDSRLAEKAFVRQYLEETTVTTGPVVRQLEDGRYAGVRSEPGFLLLALDTPSAAVAEELLSRGMASLLEGTKGD